MAINVVPITPTFAAEIGDVALSRWLDPPALTSLFYAYARLIAPKAGLRAA